MTSPHVTVIAEAGVNHDGSPEMALELVEAAAAAGADVVKFQTFRADKMIAASAPKARYQQETTGTGESQLEMVRHLELAPELHEILIERCGERGIEFLSTPFDSESLALLERLGLRRLKVPSGEITNGPLLLLLARTGLPLIVSTGMANLAEVGDALDLLAFAMVRAGQPTPSSRELSGFARRADGRAVLADRVTLLHCTTEYPAPMTSVNLRAMDSLARTFGLPVGYSDHTNGITVSIAAAARGAVVIEKHFTLDRGLPGPDHRASLEPGELGAMVAAIREVQEALGDGVKASQACERANADVARKSLIAARDIRSSECFTAENLAAMRPGTGVSPMAYWSYVGRSAGRAYSTRELIEAGVHP